MNVKRSMHELLLLDDGRVLAIGGQNERDENEPSCEIYDPATEKWTLTDSLLLIRKEEPKAVKLQNGNILITGGHRRTGIGYEEIIYSSCEIFDIQIEKWIKVADMNFARKWHTITSLNNGNILVTGGIGQGDYLNSLTEICEIYDVSANEWILGDTIKVARYDQDALLLNDSRIFISAGEIKGVYINYTEICEIYDPAIDKWYYAGVLTMYHPRHSSFQLNDSLILIVGGDNYNWEIFNLNKQQSAYVEYSDIFWKDQSVLKLSNNVIIKIGGGIYNDWVVGPTDKCEIFNFNITGIKDNKTGQIKNYELFQNYPNPFNPNTNIDFYLSGRTYVRVLIYDTTGRIVETLSNRMLEKGFHSILFNGQNYSSGLYYYKIETDEWTASKKMILLK